MSRTEGRLQEGSVFDDDTIQGLAAELEAARVSRVQIGQFSNRFPGITVDDAYRVSRAWADVRRQSGRRVTGHKVGLTSASMRKAVGISEPDFGILLDDMVLAEGEVALDRFIEPKVEAELAFVVARPLKGPGVTIFDVLAATDFVVPALEIVDARIRRFDETTKTTRKVEDTIADNGAAAGFVLGGRPVRPDSLDLRWVGVLLSRNAVVEESGIAAAVLNHPANGVVWLVNKLAEWGDGIEAGEIVLSGSFTRIVDVARGDVFVADYGELGSISLRFV